MNPTLARVGVLLLLPALSVAQEPDRVTMTLRDFLAMYEEAQDRPGPTTPAAPRPATLADVTLRGEVVRGADGAPSSAVLKGRLRIEVHQKEGWVRLPVVSADVAVLSATIGGKPAALVLEEGWYTLLTDRKGSIELDVELAAHVATEAGASGFSFPLAPAGASSVAVSIPTDEPIEVTVAGAQLQRETTRTGSVLVEAAVPIRGNLSVRWQRAARAASTDPAADVARVYAEVSSLVAVGDGLVRTSTTVDHTILFAGVDQLTYQVPDGATVLDVRASGLRDWSVSDKGVLSVQLNYAAEASLAVSVELEQLLGDGSRTVAAPVLRPLGVERTKGWVGVTASGNLEIASGDVAGASAVDVRTLPGRILGVTNQPVLLGYKYLTAEPKLPLVVTAHDEVDVLVTLLDQARATTMFTVDGRRLTQVAWDVRNNRRQFLRVGLPEGAQLWSAAVAGRAVQPAKGSDGDILVPLIRSASSGGALASFAVEVVYVESMPEPSEAGRGTFAAELPSVDVPTTYVAWTVYAPEAAKVDMRHAEGELRAVDWLRQPAAATETLVVDNSADFAQRSATGTESSGALGSGAAPVRVTLPLEGTPHYFEKLLALDERLWIEFDYRGLR